MADADVIVRPDEVQLDPLSQAQVETAGDRELSRKIEILQGYAVRKPEGKRRRLHVRFLVSPVELIGDAQGRVTRMRLVRNRLGRRRPDRSAPRRPASSRIWRWVWFSARWAIAAWRCRTCRSTSAGASSRTSRGG